MLVDALVVLSDPEANGALLTVRVRADVQKAPPGATSQCSFGPFRVVAAALGVHVRGLKKGEGLATEMDRGRELVEQESNVWRVMDCLREAYEKKAGEGVDLLTGERVTKR